MRKGIIAGALAAVVLATAGTVLHFTRRPANGDVVAPRPVDAPAAARAPAGVRIRVQVLNATRTRGLARRATMYLRDLGYDVVDIGTTTPVRDSTLVLDRSSHPDWAKRVAKAMRARSESRPDSSRYLDVTVLIGADWRAPAEPFYP